jgi:predicted transcriptional regulator
MRLDLDIDPELLRRLASEAARLGKTPSELAQQAIVELLENER